MRDAPRFLMNSRRWLMGVVVLGGLGYAFAARAAGGSDSGTWTRNVRAGGETWIYRFTVTDGAATNASTYGGAPSGGGEARRGAERGGKRSRSDASVRWLPAALPADDGGAAAGVDVVAERAYLKTASGGEGSEVATPAVGQTVYFYVDYSLTGATGIVILSRQAIFDEQEFCHITQTITAGSYSAWCETGWTATAGDHTLRWDFDYNNQVNETDETNNSATAMWTSSAVSVDLAANQAFLKTMTGGMGDEVMTPTVGQTVFFYVDLTVAGPDSGVMVDRRALIDGDVFCDFTAVLTPGDYLSWCLDGWTATAGSHTLEWDLDFDNQVAETNESNNSVSTTWTSSPPGGVDLAANRAFLMTMTDGMGDEVVNPGVGETVFFYVDLTVVGPDSGVMVDRRALIDGDVFCDFTAVLTPGDYFSWCLDGWTATAGSHTLQWDLDYNNAVPETDENNNSVSTTWASGGGTCGGDCDGNGIVTVSEVITMVNDALGDTLVCGPGDTDDDGKISIHEIVAGVDRALNGCG
jgi:hypothetical protein